MTANWTAPKTWNTGDPLTASDMNTHLRDNLEFLKDPPTNLYAVNEASNYQTTSTSFSDVDGTKLALAITTEGGDVLIGFTGTVEGSVAALLKFDVAVDGNRLGGDDGLCVQHIDGSAGRDVVSFVVWKRSLLAGPHTFKLQWAVTTGTATLYAGAGTLNRDVHGQFWVREVS